MRKKERSSQEYEVIGTLIIDEVTDVDKFHALKDIWHRLIQQCPDNNIFITWEWLYNWWQYYGRGKKLRILLIKEGRNIIGIVPFMQSRYRIGFLSVDVLENICSTECDYSGIILTERKRDAVVTLIQYLKKIIHSGNTIVRMSHIPGNSVFLGVLREQYPSFSKYLSMFERTISSCPYIDVPQNWEEYTNTLNKHGRGRLKRIGRDINVLQHNHVVKYEKLSEGDDLRNQLLSLFEIHQKRWRVQNDTSKFDRSETREFYFNVSEAFRKNNWLDLSFITVDTRPVSVAWGFVYNNTYHYMTATFDPDYSNYGVGQALTMHLLDDCIHRGIKKYDFLKGDEFFKSYWTKSKIYNVQIYIVKRGFNGRSQLKLLQMIIKLSHIGKRSFRDNVSLLIAKIRR